MNQDRPSYRCTSRISNNNAPNAFCVPTNAVKF